jgi:cellulose synthase/poly-beta-1,6-N-acetylglucosamine synthase-like glycosyltransferase
MDMISILVPVYKESGLLETLLNQLLKDSYKNKEIIAVVDEPTEKSFNTAKKYKNQVKFILNKERKGKVRALNEATRFAKGNIFLFIDSDCVISKKSKNFISKISENMKDVDILDIKKNMFEEESFLSKIFLYEYISSAFLSWTFNKMNICLGLSGQAFAIRKDTFKVIGGFGNVISEDFEIGIQAYLKGKKSKYTKDVEIYSKPTTSWKKLLAERKRWGTGSGFHVRKYWKVISKFCLKNPINILSILYTLYPTILSLIVLFFINLFLGSSLMFSKNVMLFIISYLISTIIFYTMAKFFDYKFSLVKFTIYFFVYSPFLFCLFIYSFIRASILKTKNIYLKDWKVK